MVKERKLSVFKNTKKIIFRYIEAEFPIMDTEVTIYDAYKLNIMLSDGLAAILSDRHDIYNSLSGDLFFFDPSEIHHGRILRQGIHKYIEILIPTECFPDFRSYYSLFNDRSELRTNLLSPYPEKRTVILSMAERIVSAINTASDEFSLFSDFVELLKICIDLYNDKENNSGFSNMPPTLNNAIKFIRSDFSENIQVSDIAKVSNCSTSYLSRIFKEYLGKSPYSYLTEYRLFMAEKLLRNGYSVTDVGSMTGFCDSSVFIKCFKKSFGITPFKYKKGIKE